MSHDIRLVGTKDGSGPASWTHYSNFLSSVIASVEKNGGTVFGWGPIEYVPVVHTRENLIEAMEIISNKEFEIVDWTAYCRWRDNNKVPLKAPKPPRKQFEVDFQQLSEDGKFLIKEYVDPDVAWQATMLACGESANDGKA